MLDIARIGVHAPLHALGLAADGTAAVPSGARYDQPAWYRYSVTPGAIGPAVIEGHVDSARNGPSVFFRLGSLRVGDRVGVTRADGRVAEFVVDDVQSFPKATFPTNVVYGNTDHAALRLITCGGGFDSASGHYRANIIVFARLIGSHSAG